MEVIKSSSNPIKLREVDRVKQLYAKLRLAKVMHTIKPQNDFPDHAVVEAFWVLMLNNDEKILMKKTREIELEYY